jgi:hypothetical protein
LTENYAQGLALNHRAFGHPSCDVMINDFAWQNFVARK